jgi:hypothetical protein
MKIKKGRILILIVILLSVTLTGQIFAQGQKTQKDGPITLTVHTTGLMAQGDRC